MDIVKWSSPLAPLGGSKTFTCVWNKSQFCRIKSYDTENQNLFYSQDAQEHITLTKYQAPCSFNPPGKFGRLQASAETLSRLSTDTCPRVLSDFFTGVIDASFRLSADAGKSQLFFAWNLDLFEATLLGEGSKSDSNLE